MRSLALAALLAGAVPAFAAPPPADPGCISIHAWQAEMIEAGRLHGVTAVTGIVETPDGTQTLLVYFYGAPAMQVFDFPGGCLGGMTTAPPPALPPPLPDLAPIEAVPT
jgi:hypothetical protein